MSTGLCGSEPYIAPEQFLGKRRSFNQFLDINSYPYSAYDARLVDIWACGIVYYCLHFQELPWRAAQPSSDQLYASYAAACLSTSNASPSNYPSTINNLNPRQCRSLIRKMLEPDPEKRWPIEQVVEHEWAKEIEVCTVVEAQGKEPRHGHASARTTGQSYLAVANGH